MQTESTGRNPERAQLVLVAAIALTIAMVPLVLAYVQLGYNEDLYTNSHQQPSEQVERTLQHGLHDVDSNLSGVYDWEDNEMVIVQLQERLEPTLDAVQRGGLDAGIVTQISYNSSRADRWANSTCPGGPDRQFGECDATNGVVVQEREDRTHVLGVAFDIHISTPDTDVQIITVIEPR